MEGVINNTNQVFIFVCVPFPTNTHNATDKVTEVHEGPDITLQTPDDELVEPKEPEAQTPEEKMKTSTSAPELHKLVAIPHSSPSKRRLPVPTDLPGIQTQDVVNDVGHARAGRPLFVPEVEEVRVRYVC